VKSKLNKKYSVLVLLFVLCSMLLITACFPAGIDSSVINDERLTVIAFDVDQADCIYIHTPQDENILVDTANNSDGQEISNQLYNLGVKQIDYLFLTHPHADHIGGADDIIKNFDIGKIYMPKVYHDTQTYMDVLNAAKNKGIKIQEAKPQIITLNACTINMLAPIKEGYDDLNAYSIVFKLTYKDFDMLFTGDLPKQEEGELLNCDLQADILKVAHHGSNDSTSENFLRQVGCEYAVISVGEDNSYGHPNDDTLVLLEKYNVKIFRTDLQGDIIITTDGKEVNIENVL
jgi:competence protein ComEC